MLIVSFILCMAILDMKLKLVDRVEFFRANYAREISCIAVHEFAML